jgi:hypothetical protein
MVKMHGLWNIKSWVGCWKLKELDRAWQVIRLCSIDASPTKLRTSDVGKGKESED